MKKRIIILFFVVLLLLACQPTPEMEFVVNKGDNVLEQKLYATPKPSEDSVVVIDNTPAASNDGAKDEPTADAEITNEPTAAPMVQTFPDRWDEDGITLRDYVTLSIHTDVETRADGQYPAYRTRVEPFTAEQIARIADTLLPKPVARELLEAKTKKELEAELQKYLDDVAAWEEWAANGKQGDGDDTGYDPEEVKRTTDWYMKEIQNAPDTLETVAVSDYSGYRIGQIVGYRLENGDNAVITSTVTETWNTMSIAKRCKHTGYVYWEHYYLTEKNDPTIDTDRYWKDTTLTREDAEAVLRQGLERLGIDGFSVSYAEPATLFDTSETSTVGVSGGWGFKLVHSFGYPTIDVPYQVCSLLEFGASEGFLANKPIRDESITVFVDENGIEYFAYSGQKKVLAEVNPNVELLSFADTQRIIKNALSVCYPKQRYQGREGRKIELEIYRMTLITQTLRVPDSNEFYEVPCWIILFDGFSSNNPEIRVNRNMSHDALIINAVDGSVVIPENARSAPVPGK